jgi:TolB protein
MKPHQKLLGLLVALAIASGSFAQQEVVLKISEGMPMITLALPEFVVRGGSPAAQAAAQEIRQVLMEDVKYTRIFQLLPKEYYGYIRPLDLDKIFFKDWDSVQARLLVTGEVREDGGRIVFDGKIYDVKSERFIVGKRYQAEKNGLRLVAHKMADELLKLHGEKPLFTTKIAFVSNRDGNDEIYIMDYDGANPTRVTFNKIKDYMPAWSPDHGRCVHVLPRLHRRRSSSATSTKARRRRSLIGTELTHCRLLPGRLEAGLLLEHGRERGTTTSSSWTSDRRRRSV